MKKKPSIEEIDYRTRLANCEALEIKVQRERFELSNRYGELCRIDTALNAFDGFLREFLGFLDGLPDAIQSAIPQATPAQYETIQSMIDAQIQRLAQHRLHLSIESNTDLQRANTASKKDKIARTEKRKKDMG